MAIDCCLTYCEGRILVTTAPQTFRLTPQTVRAIKLAYHFGFRVTDICEHTEISRDCVSRIVNEKTWKRVSLTRYEKAMFKPLGALFHGLPTPRSERLRVEEEREREQHRRELARGLRRPGGR